VNSEAHRNGDQSKGQTMRPISHRFGMDAQGPARPVPLITRFLESGLVGTMAVVIINPKPQGSFLPLCDYHFSRAWQVSEAYVSLPQPVQPCRSQAENSAEGEGYRGVARRLGICKVTQGKY
jgi:hypothetical protein